MANSRFEDFLSSIKQTLQSYDFEELTPRLQIVFEGANKALNDQDIMDAFNILYDDHMFVRESCNILYNVASQLLKIDCL